MSTSTRLQKFNDESEDEFTACSSSDHDSSDDEYMACSSTYVAPNRKRKRIQAPVLDDDRRDDRPFRKFMKEEQLREIKRDWKTYPVGSVCEIKTNGELWIGNEKTPVIVSENTKSEMKRLNIWDKPLKMGKDGYVCIGSGICNKLHVKLAQLKKDDEFHDLLEAGWIGKKEDLVVLHLNDCPLDFNLDNLRWHTHVMNNLLKKSKGTKHGKKFQCSTHINGHNESTSLVSTLAEAIHAVDILKICNVDPADRNIVFHYGLNYVYPNIETLMARSHMYKTSPSFQGNPFKSKAVISLVDWSEADQGLQKAVEESKVPFDYAVDVCVMYKGSGGRSFHFVIERACYDTHFLHQQVSCGLADGYVQVKKENVVNKLHRLVLGLDVGDEKLGRHRVEGMDGKRDNRKRVLRTGFHSDNLRDVNRKTPQSSSSHAGVSWDKGAQCYRAQMRFSNSFCSFKKYLGLFGVKGDKTTGADEAAQWRNKVHDHSTDIIELLKDIEDLAEFKRRVDEEVEKLK